MPRALQQYLMRFAAYIAAAYWFTASTSFANPAERSHAQRAIPFAGIRPDDAPAFIGAQLLGAGMATWVVRWLLGPPERPEF